jgi:hypothetical protein
MDFGTLSLTHEIIGKLYLVVFNLIDDPTYDKEDTIDFIQQVIVKMDELADLMK